MIYSRKPLISVAVLLFVSICVGKGEMLPFVLPWNDTSENLTNLSGTISKPVGESEWVQVTDDGHFKIGQERIRFYGVNIVAGAAFPPLEKAEKIAQRMARFGLNVARFHHMDNNWGRSIIDYESGSSTHLNLENLDRLDRMLAELKSVGIYSNINLLCSREFKAADGLHPEVEKMDWKASHILAFFDEGARNLQKQFAIDLLTHTNPYTKLRYLDDPAIAFVEINNENGLLHQWHSGGLNTLPEFYETELRVAWNRWLGSQYDSTKTLLDDWGSIDQPLGSNLLADFTEASWNLEQHETARASLKRTSTTATIEVQQISNAGWHVQFSHGNLSSEANQVYTLRFSIRSEEVRSVSLSWMQAHDPWQNLGFSTPIAVNPSWQDFEFTFVPSDNDQNARLTFGNLGAQSGVIEIRNLTLQKGGKIGFLDEGVSLEQSNIPIIRSDSRELPGTMRDWFQFLMGLESEYWRDMKAFIRGLGYPGIIWGTTIMNSTPHLQSGMDAIDSHTYWQHPHFIGEDWSQENWTVGNESMVNDLNGGVIPNLAWQRIAGMPHNVTEYQHSSPNPYGSEGPLFLAAYGSLQDWDGLYLFHYGSADDDWDRGYFNGFFDVDQHPSKLINASLASLLFRRFDIKPAEKVLNIPFSKATNMELALNKGAAWNVADARHLEYPDRIPLIHRVQMDLSESESKRPVDSIEIAAIELPAINETTIQSDTQEITWDHTSPMRSVVSLDTDRAKAVWGYQNGKIWAWPGLHMQFSNTQDDWCTAAVILIEGTSFTELAQGAKGLIVTTGNTENTNMGWKSSERTSVGSNWGASPTLVENISGFVVFEIPAASVKVWSLDERGNRSHRLPVVTHEIGCRIDLGGSLGSIWYEFEITPN